MRISDWSSDVCSSDLGTLSSLASELSQPELEAAAGNGGNEIRAWLMLAAAMNDAPGRTLAYPDMPEWLTGMAVAVIEPDEKMENCNPDRDRPCRHWLPARLSRSMRNPPPGADCRQAIGRRQSRERW